MTINRGDVTVYIVDDEYPVRDSLSMLIQTEGLTTKSYDSALEFLKNYQPEQPACLVLDVSMPEMDGIELQHELKENNINIPTIFISGHGDVPMTAKAFREGAVDFFEKPFNDQLLLQRINETVSKVIDAWQERCKKQQIKQCYASLTEREKEVMKLIVSNHSNKQAARILGISNRTVDVHRAHVMEKMEAESLSDLIVKAIVCGILYEDND